MSVYEDEKTQRAFDNSQSCPTCSGVGNIIINRSREGNPNTTEPCERCNGTGQVPAGKGKIPDIDEPPLITARMDENMKWFSFGVLHQKAKQRQADKQNITCPYPNDITKVCREKNGYHDHTFDMEHWWHANEDETPDKPTGSGKGLTGSLHGITVAHQNYIGLDGKPVDPRLHDDNSETCWCWNTPTSTEPTPEGQTFEETARHLLDIRSLQNRELPHYDTVLDSNLNHLMVAHNTALDEARTDQWEKDRIEIVEREQAARRQQEVKIWDDLGVMKLGLRFNDKITELVITDEQYDHLRSFIAALTKHKAE